MLTWLLVGTQLASGLICMHRGMRRDVPMMVSGSTGSNIGQGSLPTCKEIYKYLVHKRISPNPNMATLVEGNSK